MPASQLKNNDLTKKKNRNDGRKSVYGPECGSGHYLLKAKIYSCLRKNENGHVQEESKELKKFKLPRYKIKSLERTGSTQTKMRY